MKYGIIDIGSNTFRLIIAEIKGNSFFVIDGFKENVRLSAGLDKNSNLNDEKMEFGLKTLKMLVNYCRLSNCDEIRVAATAALRKAENRQVFLDYAREKIGIEVQLLSGESEAMYDYIGSVNSLSVDDYLFMDIGGGSSELGLVQKRKLINSISLPFGAVDLAQSFGLDEKPSLKDIKKLEKFVLEQFKQVEWLKEAKGLPIVGIGGTIRSIGKIQKRKEDYPLSAIHNYYIKDYQVNEIFDIVSNLNMKDRSNIDGLGKDRADIFVGACGAVKYLIDYCKSSEMIISRDGLREGLLYEKLGFGLNNVTDSPLIFSVENMMRVYGVDIEHGKHVRLLMNKLFEELTDVHKITGDVSDIIYTAGMLHDVGKLIDYKNHSEHTFYIILNSILNGLNHKNQLIAAIIAGNHTTSKLKIDLNNYVKILSTEDLILIDKISMLLRLAEGLDRSLSMKVKDILCRLVDDNVIIKTINYDDISLESAYLRTFENDFKKTFGYKMIIV